MIEQNRHRQVDKQCVFCVCVRNVGWLFCMFVRECVLVPCAREHVHTHVRILAYLYAAAAAAIAAAGGATVATAAATGAIAGADGATASTAAIFVAAAAVYIMLYY